MVPDNLYNPHPDGKHAVIGVLGSIGVILLAFLLANVLSVFAFVALSVESLEALNADPVLYAVVNAISFVGFILAAVGYVGLRKDWDLIHVRRPSLWDIGYILGGLILLAMAAFSMSALVSAIMFALEELFGVGTEIGENTVITTGEQNPTIFLYMIPVALFLVGTGEELVFRGVVQGLLRRAFGVVPAVLLASLVFGMGHYFAISQGNAWTYIFIAGGMGLVLGAVYEYTENIAVPIVIHGLWNAILFGLNYLMARGALPTGA